MGRRWVGSKASVAAVPNNESSENPPSPPFRKGGLGGFEGYFPTTKGENHEGRVRSSRS
jgi:hypothetical protein